MQNNTKILITWGTGFIGYHLAKKCLDLNWSVTSVSIHKPKKIRKLIGVNYLIFDISKKKNLISKLSKNYDYVVNLAGYVDHSHKTKTMKSHFDGCKNLAKFFLYTNIKKFIQIGSSIEYGTKKSPQFENSKITKKTNSIYGDAKLFSTKLLLRLFKDYNFPVTIVRLYLVYGPNQDMNRIVPITIKNAIKNQKFDCSNGKQLRDFIYIDDVISALIKILKNSKSSGEIINIGNGKPMSIKKMILKICKLLNAGKPQFGKIKLRKDEALKSFPSIKKIKSLIFWHPRTNFDKGLVQTIKYFKSL